MYDSHFSLNNIPYGIASKTPEAPTSVATRLFDTVIFLDEVAKAGLLLDLPYSIVATFPQPNLNALASLDRVSHLALRASLQNLLSNLSHLPPSCTARASTTTLHLPVYTRTFSDFLCSSAHILNAGAAMRGTPAPLPPSFLNLPIGYTGSASSLIVSGTDVVRPKGLVRSDVGKDGEFVFKASERLDYELEVGLVVGKTSERGYSVGSAEVDEYIFGLVLVNDWSSRDIQAVEMQPLGPHSGKSFATTISPWVVTTLALEPFAIKSPPRRSSNGYIVDAAVEKNTYDIHLEALILSGEKDSRTVVCRSEFRDMDWTLRDLLMQKTANGCQIEVGDILASGTVSGPGEGEGGCLLEVNGGGKTEWTLKNGERRTWIEDGDSVVLTGWASEGVGFGECIGKVVPAK